MDLESAIVIYQHEDQRVSMPVKQVISRLRTAQSEKN